MIRLAQNNDSNQVSHDNLFDHVTSVEPINENERSKYDTKQ